MNRSNPVAYLRRAASRPRMQHATALLERLRGAHTDSRLHANLIEVLADTLAYVQAPDEEGRARTAATIQRAHIGPHFVNTLDEAMALNRCGETPFGVLQQVLPALAAVLPPHEEDIRRVLHGLPDALMWRITHYVVESGHLAYHGRVMRPRWTDPARVARALREGSVDILERYFSYHPEERTIYEVLDLCESAMVRDALAYSVLEHYVRRIPEWVHAQVASEASVGNVPRIYKTIRCVVALRLHHAGEILLHMLVTLGPEVDAQLQAQPQRARLRQLRNTLRAGEARLRGVFEPRWLAVRMALQARLGAQSPLRVVGDDGLAEAMMRGGLEA